MTTELTPAKVRLSDQLGLGAEARHLPTPAELRSYADDADQHGNHWVPISPASLRGMADEFERQAAELDRRFGIGALGSAVNYSLPAASAMNCATR